MNRTSCLSAMLAWPEREPEGRRGARALSSCAPRLDPRKPAGAARSLERRAPLPQSPTSEQESLSRGMRDGKHRRPRTTTESDLETHSSRASEATQHDDPGLEPDGKPPQR